MARTGYIWICAALVLGAATGLAADKYAADWLSYGAGARALGMGGAFVAVADDGSAPYWNPAGMPAVKRAAATAMHSYAFNGLATYDSLYGVYNFGTYGAVGAGLLRFATDDIQRTDWTIPGDPTSRPQRLGYFNWSDNGVYLSYGRGLTPWLAAGVSGVVIVGDHYRSEWNATGEAADVGLLAGPFRGFTFGLNAQDLFGRVQWKTGTTETIPMNVKLGAAYRRAVPDWKSEFLFALGSDAKLANYGDAAQVSAGDASFDFCGGGEWWYRRTLAVRLGSERSALTGGVGLAARALGAEFGVDYAYLSDTGLDASHRASVSVAF